MCRRCHENPTRGFSSKMWERLPIKPNLVYMILSDRIIITLSQCEKINMTLSASYVPRMQQGQNLPVSELCFY